MATKNKMQIACQNKIFFKKIATAYSLIVQVSSKIPIISYDNPRKNGGNPIGGNHSESSSGWIGWSSSSADRCQSWWFQGGYTEILGGFNSEISHIFGYTEIL